MVEKLSNQEILILRALRLILKWQYWGSGTRETIKDYDEIMKAIYKIIGPEAYQENRR